MTEILSPQTLLARNQAWRERLIETDPTFFSRLADQQAPQYLWIGCSDSRVPASELVDLPPGEVFVHRNVANQVVHTDFNCLSVMQYAIDVLRVKHVIVCGHYRCGGVVAAYERQSLGLIDNWLRHIQDVMVRHRLQLEALPEPERLARLCELNVLEQVVCVAQTTFVQRAWQEGQPLEIHGWIYDVGDGLLRDLQVSVSSVAGLEALVSRTQPV